MDKEIIKIRQEGDLVTLRATRKFLEDLIVFLKDTPAIGKEAWGTRAQYSDCLDLAVDLEDMLAREKGDVLEFQRDREYFFYNLDDAMHMDVTAIALDEFPKVNTLPRERVSVMSRQISKAYYGAPQEH